MSRIRIERCYTENIYLIESIPPDEENPLERNYIIMGNSGRTYQVTISNNPTCTCPDYMTRLNRCKHIFFVLIRIMKIENYSEEYYTDEELTQMFLNIPDVAKNLMYTGEKPQEQEEVDQKFDKGDICPICLDELENGKELDYCKYSCGKTIHKKCFSMWEKSKGGICVFCRAKWYSNFPPTHHKKISMHPIDPNRIDIEEKKDSFNNGCDKIDIEEDNNLNEDIELKTDEERSDNRKRNRRNKSRKRNKIRKKCKSEDKSMSISENKSRSRSRDRYKSRSRSRSRNKKLIKYPKS